MRDTDSKHMEDGPGAFPISVHMGTRREKKKESHVALGTGGSTHVIRIDCPVANEASESLWSQNRSCADPQ